MKNRLPNELKKLVSWSVEKLGEAIKEEYGEEAYRLVEQTRQKMVLIRQKNDQDKGLILRKLLKKYRSLDANRLEEICHAFSCMMELINRCESVYRDFRVKGKNLTPQKKGPYAIIYVLTAHPTEARSPEALGVFKSIQILLMKALQDSFISVEQDLRHYLRISLKTSLSRSKKPTVADEARHIYNFVLAPTILESLVQGRGSKTAVSLRSWVGGDKDGHPGVDEKTMLESLELSRGHLIVFINQQLLGLQSELDWLDNGNKNFQRMKQILLKINAHLEKMEKIRERDGEKAKQFKLLIGQLAHQYKILLGLESLHINKILSLIWLFPALALPLELREDSTIVGEAIAQPQKYAIGRMLITLKKISTGLDPKWYVRGFVLSMVETSEHFQGGIKLVQKVLGKLIIPVVPLFENQIALTNATSILRETFLAMESLKSWHHKYYGGRFEIMLGYSDSSKENGVFPSRLMISRALRKIDHFLTREGLTPVFFHGSGGSVERGGGSIKEQTSWWPKSALNIFKATIQGEMVARNFATAPIFNGQVSKIIESFERKKYVRPENEIKTVLTHMSNLITQAYKDQIRSPAFLHMVERATPYSYLSLLKIGSRPSKRSGGIHEGGLRAIPWILCWTQTRTLFPTWWGIGSSYQKLTSVQKTILKRAYRQNDFFKSFIHVLGFTLSKVELSVWDIYLDNSGLSKSEIAEFSLLFHQEFKKAKAFFRAITGESQLLFFRPWLGDSIKLRSSMIHPLNLIQLVALEQKNEGLLRESVTGVACGMLTTG